MNTTVSEEATAPPDIVGIFCRLLALEALDMLQSAPLFSNYRQFPKLDVSGSGDGAAGSFPGGADKLFIAHVRLANDGRAFWKPQTTQDVRKKSNTRKIAWCGGPTSRRRLE
jgi:hypothetical protein